MDPYSLGFGTSGELPLNHKVFLAAFDTIKSIAEKDGSCVFVGRCADYALRDYSNVINAFIYADLDDRVKRVAKKYDLADGKSKGFNQKKKINHELLTTIIILPNAGAK